MQPLKGVIALDVESCLDISVRESSNLMSNVWILLPYKTFITVNRY